MNKIINIEFSVDIAPKNEEDFKKWCNKWNFDYFGGSRRAWCPDFQTYFRNAKGVGVRDNGDEILVYEDDLKEVLEDLKMNEELLVACLYCLRRAKTEQNIKFEKDVFGIWFGDCECCGDKHVSMTAIRDFGNPKIYKNMYK
jgi:hypothetical protein